MFKLETEIKEPVGLAYALGRQQTVDREFYEACSPAEQTMIHNAVNKLMDEARLRFGVVSALELAIRVAAFVKAARRK